MSILILTNLVRLPVCVLEDVKFLNRKYIFTSAILKSRLVYWFLHCYFCLYFSLFPIISLAVFLPFMFKSFAAYECCHSRQFILFKVISDFLVFPFSMIIGPHTHTHNYTYKHTDTHTTYTHTQFILQSNIMFIYEIIKIMGSPFICPIFHCLFSFSLFSLSPIFISLLKIDFYCLS